MTTMPTAAPEAAAPITLLIEQCINNNLNSQEQLYRQCYVPMIKICLRYGGDMDKAGMIFNDAMLRVFRALPQYRHNDKFWSWVKTIVLNCCLDHIRRETRFPETGRLSELEEISIPGEDIIERLTAGDIQNYIRQLPPATATVFNLFVYEGYTHTQVSAALGISEGTSKWHVSQARKILYAKMNAHLKP